MEFLRSSKAPQPVGPYSHAVKAGDFIFISGQIGMDPKTGELVSHDIRDQTAVALSNIKAILEEVGLPIESIVKTTVFLTDMKYFTSMNEIYSGFFGSHKPARSCVAVAQLPKNALVEIEAVAYVS
ncbi:MAG: RidA family protein [Syntrophobacterales bacterium]|nr:RidA family protein [Syntrophobacterales bacterium]